MTARVGDPKPPRAGHAVPPGAARLDGRPVPLDRVGIVMMSAVGDTVHVLPILAALKRHAPACRVTWVLQPGPASLVRGHPAVDDIVVFDRSAGWRAFAAVRQSLIERPLDLLIDFQVYLKAGIVTALSRAPIKLGFDRARARDANWLFTTHRIPARPPQHVQDQYFEFLDALSVPRDPVGPTWNLGPWPAERPAQQEFLQRQDRPVAAIVVGTSKAHKDWLPDRWAHVARALYSDFGLQPVLVGGTAPREQQSAALVCERAPEVRSALGSGLRPLVGILDGAALVLSPDTGPLHMSVALDRPVISLLGYTNPKRTGPYRKFHDLTIDAYGDPGEDYPLSATTRSGRMSRITVNDVLEKVQYWNRTYR